MLTQDSGASLLIRQFERIRAAAQTGLNYSLETPSHRALFSEIMEACNVIARSTAGENFQPFAWSRMVTELGCITPKVGAVVGVLRTDGCLLILQRLSGAWCLPCGYADIGETPEDTAIRETFEETGLVISGLELLHLATTRGDTSMPFMWEAVFVARSISGDVSLSHEHLAAEWISQVDARKWHSTHQRHASATLASTNNGFLASGSDNSILG